MTTRVLIISLLKHGLSDRFKCLGLVYMNLHGHLIEGGKASFHHLDFKKINDDIHNFIFMPDKLKEITVNYCNRTDRLVLDITV